MEFYCKLRKIILYRLSVLSEVPKEILRCRFLVKNGCSNTVFGFIREV